MAASVIGVDLPVLIGFHGLQRHLVTGLAAGAVT
jgi:ABC-type glycerol-3-phosphate transport system permease component